MRSLPFYTVIFLSTLVLFWNYSHSEYQLGEASFVAAAEGERSHGDSAGVGPRSGGSAATPDGAPSDLVSVVGGTARERLEGRAGDEPVLLGGLENRGQGAGRHGDGASVPDTWIRVVETFPGGAKRAEGYRENGLNVGRWIEWYEDGAVEAEGEYVDGEPEGEWVRHRKSGGMQASEYYTGGELAGLQHSWHENGILAEEGSYDAGTPIGQWVQWYSNGQVRSRGGFSLGKRTGYWEFYDFEGRVDIRTGHYTDGRLDP